MKKTLFTMLACGLCVGLAQADEQEENSVSMSDLVYFSWDLSGLQGEGVTYVNPTNANVTSNNTDHTAWYEVEGTNAGNIMANLAGKDTGVYVMSNVHTENDWSASNDLAGEGVLTKGDNGFDTKLFARTGGQGETLAIVLDYATINSEVLNSVSFSVAGVTTNTDSQANLGNYWVTLAVVDENGNYKQADGQNLLAQGAKGENGNVSLTLDLSNVENWVDSDRIIATITGGSSSAWTHSASISGIKLVTVIPEPATASLSLLALAGLAARRRRK